MDAVSIALRTLAWAADPVGTPPAGPLRGVRTLMQPPPQAVRAVGHSVAVTAARLQAGSPPLGDTGAVGLATLLLAAAVGGRMEPNIALGLLDAVEPVTLRRHGWAECVARHGVVAPAVASSAIGVGVSAMATGVPGSAPAGVDASAQLAPALVDALLRVSPLTAVLHRPAAAPADGVRRVAVQLLDRPHGAGLMVAALSAPPGGGGDRVAVLSWRAEVLELLRQERPEAMLDVYTAALTWHGGAWADEVTRAGRDLAGYGRAGAEPIATLRFWTALARMHRDEAGLRAAGRQHGDAGSTIAGRVFLRAGQYQPVLRLIDRYRLLQWEGES